eukprot:COSAG01_NODE_9744_length_2356_cov_3.062472_4_plen_25_part_01
MVHLGLCYTPLFSSSLTSASKAAKK